MSYDSQIQRLIHPVSSLGKGLNLARPGRELGPDEASGISNCLIRTGRVFPGKAAGAVVYTLSEAIRHSFVFPSELTRFLIMLGTEKVWAVSTAAPAEITPTPDFSSVTYPLWEGEVLLDSLGLPAAIVNNRGTDKPHYWDGRAGPFLILTNAPFTKCFTGWMNRMVCGNVYDGSSWLTNRIQWSLDGNFSVFSGTTAGWLDLYDVGDPIQRLGRLPGNLLAILRSESVWIGAPANTYTDLLDVAVFYHRGILAPASLQAVADGYIFLGPDDVYFMRPSGVESIGVNIRRELFRQASSNKLDYGWSYQDKREKDYYLILEQADGTRKAWIYNCEERTWSAQDATDWSALVTWYETT